MDESTLEAPPMPGAEHTATEIVARTSQHVVDVMPIITDAEINKVWRVAQALAASRMFKDIHQAEQAFAKILIGRDLGLSPTQSMQGIYVFDGNIQIAGPTLGAFIKRRKPEGYNYRILERTHERARILFITPDGTDEDVSEYSIEDAAKAGLTGKKNWKADPRSMLLWRAMSNGVKAFCPEILGGIPIYVEGEIEDHRPEPVGGGQPAALPHGLEALLQRAWAVDRRAFPRNEIVARLDGSEQAIEAVTAEVGQWLAEHEGQAAPAPAPDGGEEEVTDAEVVHDAPQEAPAEAKVDDFTRLLALEDRWNGDAEWRAQVEPLLSQRVDLADADEETSTVDAQLNALGVPAGWLPQSLGQQEG